MTWLRDAYRGFLWPYLVFLAAVGYGISAETHWTLLNDCRWPLLAAALIAMNITSAKLKRSMK